MFPKPLLLIFSSITFLSSWFFRKFNESYGFTFSLETSTFGLVCKIVHLISRSSWIPLQVQKHLLSRTLGFLSQDLHCPLITRRHNAYLMLRPLSWPPAAFRHPHQLICRATEQVYSWGCLLPPTDLLLCSWLIGWLPHLACWPRPQPRRHPWFLPFHSLQLINDSHMEAGPFSLPQPTTLVQTIIIRYLLPDD